MHGSQEEKGVVGMAVDQLFYAVEETPDRRFLMQVFYRKLWESLEINSLSNPYGIKNS